MIQHIRLPITLDRGVHLTRTIIDSDGIIVKERDTLVVGKYNDQYNEAIRTGASYFGKIKQGVDGSYLFIHEFIPQETSALPMAAMLVRFDQYFNAIDSVDLTSFPYGEFKSMAIMEYTNERIVLRGCEMLNDICNPFYYVLDSDYNLINSIKANSIIGNVYGRPFVNSDHKIYGLYSNYINEGHSEVILTYENQTAMDTVQVFEVVESSWAAGVDYYTQLDNGDWLIKFVTGCWGDGVFNSTFHEVWRVSETDFALMVSTSDAIEEKEDIKISPNPVRDNLHLDLERTTIGSITIYDSHGRQIFSLPESELDGSDIDVLSLSSGIYTLHILDSKGIKRQRRFIKI